MRGRAGALLLAVTAALGVAAAVRWPRLEVAAGLTRPNDALAALDREITDEFGLARPVVFVVVAREGTIWTRGGLAKVVALTREVLTLPGVIATDVVSLASPNMRELRLADGALEPAYLMVDVPPDDAAIAILRSRVDADPNYGGNLVSRDGRAALVVASFLPGVPDHAIAAAALATRARHDDALAAVHVTGGPVLLPEAGAALGAAAGRVGVAALLGAALLLVAAGPGPTLGAAAAALVAVAWGAAALVAWGTVLLPWSAYGVATGGLLAAVCALVPLPLHARSLAALVAPALAAALVLALALDAPAAALGVALAIAAVGGPVAGAAVAAGAGVAPSPREAPAPATDRPLWLRFACLAAIALAWLGALGLDASFGLAGYGERYLPPAARSGLDALRRHFPPPSTFVVRLRGEPGFVAEPAVLNAMHAVAAELRRDPGVRSVQSLADLVQLVHRAFRDDDPAHRAPKDDDPARLALPDDRGLIARYLTLAYSPGFRRFVDRGLSRTALWVYVEDDDPATLERVHARLAAALAAQPLPGVAIDPVSGDGALAVEMAHDGWRLAAATALAAGLLAAVAALAAGGSPLAVALDVLAGALGALLVGAGLAGWLGLALDLVVLPLLACAVLLGGAVALLSRVAGSGPRLAAFGTALAVASLPLATAPLGALRALVPLLVAPLAALASLATVARRPRGG